APKPKANPVGALWPPMPPSSRPPFVPPTPVTAPPGPPRAAAWTIPALAETPEEGNGWQDSDNDDDDDDEYGDASEACVEDDDDGNDPEEAYLADEGLDDEGNDDARAPRGINCWG
ncbi:MAG: hypothetical protein NTV86_14280, partial [Planctomycetota bacterium]|nr:hypothetical protein [Planctomycetota bacterium]